MTLKKITVYTTQGYAYYDNVVSITENKTGSIELILKNGERIIFSRGGWDSVKIYEVDTPAK